MVNSKSYNDYTQKTFDDKMSDKRHIVIIK